MSEERNIDYILRFTPEIKDNLSSLLQDYSINYMKLIPYAIVKVNSDEEESLLEKLSSIKGLEYHRSIERKLIGGINNEEKNDA